MDRKVIFGSFILLTLVLLSCGCMEPPIREPTVSVSDIALSDVSLKTMTVNTTVVIFNPNPIGAKLNKVAFDVYYLDETRNYLGHGEQTNIEMENNGNTTVTIPVIIGTNEAVNAVVSLFRKGSITVIVNGSAFIDVKVTSFEKPFEKSEEFRVNEFESLSAVTPAGTTLSIADTLRQLGGIAGIT